MLLSESDDRAPASSSMLAEVVQPCADVSPAAVLEHGHIRDAVQLGDVTPQDGVAALGHHQEAAAFSFEVAVPRLRLPTQFASLQVRHSKQPIAVSHR